MAFRMKTTRKYPLYVARTKFIQWRIFSFDAYDETLKIATIVEPYVIRGRILLHLNLHTLNK